MTPEELEEKKKQLKEQNEKHKESERRIEYDLHIKSVKDVSNRMKARAKEELDKAKKK